MTQGDVGGERGIYTHVNIIILISPMHKHTTDKNSNDIDNLQH